MASQDFQFIPPPEAPTFRPTWDEFQDALQYINKIRPVAEQYGICKIIPPPDWQPPFAVDVDNFKFTPRIQRLNELEAHTRIKLNFLDQIAKFWELQGSSLKIPVLEKKALDLYSLHKRVQDSGGCDIVSRNRGWNRIAIALGFAPHKNLGVQLRQLYDRILQPFDIFNKSKEVPLGEDQAASSDDDPDYAAAPHDYKPHQIPSRMAGKIPESEKNGRRSRRYQASEEDDEECSPDSKELKSLQFKGPGPKNADVDKETKTKGRCRKNMFYDHDPLAKYICLNCGRGDAEENMLLCDGCDDSYHTFCLLPAMVEIPKGDWRCPKCVAVEVSKPLEAFGFEQAQKEYNLQSFGEMADKFKQDYFNMPVHLVPLDMSEREFWRIVSSIDEDVTVEYGADLHTMDHGSGFPTQSSSNLMPADKEYATDSWNLNNLPIQEGSVLGHIGCDISGMKVPWMYVGMCFSTFCWHNEDHWSYSINYLHWGEPKTWYGVPGGEAEKFESRMKLAAPELFQSQPDLLHQLVTIMNPNILMKNGVPIVRCDQHAGEFMITFPRSYHAGFNQGYNFAEAVNFAPPDWLCIGRECISHYSNLKRYCVFSHDELVCKMAASPESLELTVAAATYQDMLKMVDQEKRLRKTLLHWGVTSAEREAFELLPDDERQCEYCKTTCFLSAVTCSCSPAKLVCLRHYNSLCECGPTTHILRYRYTLDELPPMLHKLKERAESFDNWASKVKQALEAKMLEDKLELEELRELVTVAEERRFPDSELLGALLAAVAEADKCAAVGAHLAAKKVRTRTRGCGDPKSRLTLEELQLFYDQISSLACTIKEADGVKQLLDTVMQFQETAAKALQENDEWMVNWQMRREEDEEQEEKKIDMVKKEAKDEKDEKMELDDKDKKCVDEDSKMDTSDVATCDNNKDESMVSINSNESSSSTNTKKKKRAANAGSEAGDDSKMDTDDVKAESSYSADEDDLVQSEELSKLVETGLSLDIDLPELPMLRIRLQKVLWLEEVEDSLEPTSAVSCDVVRELLSKSQSLPPHRRVEDTRQQLQQLLTDMQSWDSKAAALLQTKSSSVEEAENLLAEALKVPAHLPAVSNLKDAVKRGKDWQLKARTIYTKFQPLQQSAADKTPPVGSNNGKIEVPLLEVVESLIHKAKPIPLLLPELHKIDEGVHLAQAWLERTARTFLKKNSHYSLIEVLAPRSEIGVVSCNKRKRVKKDDTTLQQTAQLLDVSTQDASVSNIMVRAYRDCEVREVKAVRAIRAHNLSKKYEFSSNGSRDNDDDLPATFCVCHKPAAPDMLQCAVCCDRFHSGCVPSPPTVRTAPSADPEAAVAMTRFICPCCHRSRRPRLDTILALLMTLQKIHIRMLEAGALQCLTERAMGWQDRAQSVLHSDELSTALTTLTAAYRRIVEQSSDDDGSTSDKLWGTNLGLKADDAAKPNSDANSGKSGNNNIIGGLNHAKITSILSTISGGPDTPLVKICEETRVKMKDLLMEGELLEVTMEETLQLWRLLQVAENPVSKTSEIVVMLGNISNQSEEKTSNKKSSNKKRKHHSNESNSAVTDSTIAKSTNNPTGKTGNKSPKRSKVSNNNSTAVKTNQGDSGSVILAGKKLKKKANSTSKLPDTKKKDSNSPAVAAATAAAPKKKRPLAASQSSSNINPSPGNTKPATQPKSPKKQPPSSNTSNNTNNNVTNNKLGPVNSNSPSVTNNSTSNNKKKKTTASRTHSQSRSNSNNNNNATTTTTTNNATNGSGTGSSSSSDDDDLCAAARCKIPVGSAVDWVQCDKCNGWFHYVCVGLKQTDLTEDEDYICIKCNDGLKSTVRS